MTAALVMLARERGELALTDTVGRFLPGTVRSPTRRCDPCCRTPPASPPSRSARGGSGRRASPWTSWPRGTRAPRGCSSRAARYHYSNTGFGVLGEVVAPVSAVRPWFDALRAQVLEPLGMSRTSYQSEAPYAEGFAVHHLTGELTVEPLPDTGVMAPAGQLWSTVPDLAHLADRAGRPGPLGAVGRLAGGDAHAAVRHAGGPLGDALRPRLPGDLQPRPGAGRPRRLDAGLLLRRRDRPRQPGRRDRADQRRLRPRPTCRSGWSTRRSTPSRRSRPSGCRRASRCADDLRDLVGIWHWGQAPTLLRVDGDGFTLGPVDSGGRRMAFSRTGPDTFVGTRGYHAGETLHVVRRRGRVGLAPRGRDVRLHPHALRPGRADPRRPPGLDTGELRSRTACRARRRWRRTSLRSGCWVRRRWTSARRADGGQ